MGFFSDQRAKGAVGEAAIRFEIFLIVIAIVCYLLFHKTLISIHTFTLHH